MQISVLLFDQSSIYLKQLLSVFLVLFRAVKGGLDKTSSQLIEKYETSLIALLILDSYIHSIRKGGVIYAVFQGTYMPRSLGAEPPLYRLRKSFRVTFGDNNSRSGVLFDFYFI